MCIIFLLPFSSVSINRFKKPSLYREGEYVLTKNTRSVPGENTKIKPHYKGPYIKFSEIIDMSCVTGFNVTPRPLNTVLSSDRINLPSMPFHRRILF